MNTDQNKFFFTKVNLFLLITIILGILVCYFIFNWSVFFDGKVEFLDSSNFSLTIGNSMSLSDTAGVNLDISDLDSGIIDEMKISIKATGKVKYELYLTEEVVDSRINPNYVKVYLTDSNKEVLSLNKSNKILAFSDLRVLKGLPSSRLIYSGVLEDGEIKDFILRIWLSDSYVLTSEGKSFSIKVNVRAKS